MRLITTLIIVVCIIFMSIGYSALNSELSISGEALVEPVTEIKITNITTLSAEDGAFTTYNPTFTKNTSNTSVTLPNENSNITLILEVTNSTSDYYHLDKIFEESNSNNNIKYEVLDKEIIYFHPNSVTEIKVIFSNETYDSLNSILNLNLIYFFEKITYKNLEYITFSGSQYIESGLSNTGDYIFETEFNQTAHTLLDGGWIISGRSTSAYTLGVFIGKSGVFNGYGGITSAKLPNIPVNSGWHTLYFSRFIHTIDNYNYSVNGKKIIPIEYERYIRIGGATEAYAGGDDFRHFIGHMKEFKITDADTGKILRYYVPAEIIEGPNVGEVGFWDVINNEFCANDGTGAFLAP